MPSFVFVIVFFFSSRRRHTRYWRDWSSDVCSSDLEATQTGATWGLDRIDQRPLPLNGRFGYTRTASNVYAYIIDTGIQRSEERRVGKECRSRWSPYH